MTQHAWLDPRPFYLQGGPVGCLLIHGFTGAPPEMKPMGEYLAARGLTVSGPLLAGHGTDYHDLEKTTWQDWYASAEAAYLSLRQECKQVFVGGLSLGSLMALRLAALQPVDGVIPCAPALFALDGRVKYVRLLRHFVRWVRKEEPQHSDLTDPDATNRLWSYEVNPSESAYQVTLVQKDVRERLPSIKAPILIFHTKLDGAIRPECGQMTYDCVGSSDKELVVLHNSGHCLTVDSEREFVWRKTHEWIAQRSSAHAGSA